MVALYVVLLYGTLYLLKKFRNDYLERAGVSISNFVVMIRTSRLNILIERIGRRWSRAWAVLSSIGILVGFALMALGVYFVHRNAIGLLYREAEASPVTPLIPGFTIGLNLLPYFALAFIIVLIPHEFFHGFIAASEGIRIKSSGIFLLFVFLGGFIEPDERQLTRSRWLSKIRVFSGGSFANFLVFLAITAIMMLTISPGGVVVRSVLEDYPAEKMLNVGDVILSLNSTSIRSLEDLSAFMSRTKPGNLVIMKVKSGGHISERTVMLAAHPLNSSRGFIGASFSTYYGNEVLYNSLWWSSNITLSIAVINMLPIVPLDGGQILLAVLSRFLKGDEIAGKIMLGVSAYFAILLVLNILLTFTIWGLRPWVP